MQTNKEIARSLNFFTSYLCEKDQDAVANFVAEYFCADDPIDDYNDDMESNGSDGDHDEESNSETRVEVVDSRVLFEDDGPLLESSPTVTEVNNNNNGDETICDSTSHDDTSARVGNGSDPGCTAGQGDIGCGNKDSVHGAGCDDGNTDSSDAGVHDGGFRDTSDDSVRVGSYDDNGVRDSDTDGVRDNGCDNTNGVRDSGFDDTDGVCNNGCNDTDGGHDSGHGDGDTGGNDAPGRCVDDEMRTVDKDEIKIVEDFFANGCGCKEKCSEWIGVDVVKQTRAECAELTRNELDMYIMGQLSCTTYTSKDEVYCAL